MRSKSRHRVVLKTVWTGQWEERHMSMVLINLPSLLAFKLGFNFRVIISNTYDFNETRVEFDEDGERISVRYQILNSNTSNQLIDVGEYVSDSQNTLINVNKANIIWPGSTKQKPDGTKWSAKFKVVVIEEKPFVFKIPKPKHMHCIHVYNYSVECPWSNGKPTFNFF